MSNYIIDDTVNEARSGFPLGSYILPLLCVDNAIRVTEAHSTTMALYSGSSVRNPTFTGHRQIMQLNICIRATCMKYLRFQQKACRIAALTEYPYQRLFLHSALCSHFLIHLDVRCIMFESAANYLKLENKPQVIKMIFQLAQRMLYFSCETCVLIVANRNFSNEITKLCKTTHKQCPGNREKCAEYL